MGFIYRAVCVCHTSDGARYIGQTRNSVRSREGVHLWAARTPESKSHTSHLSNWIRKHGARNIRFEPVQEVPNSELDRAEVAWIQRETRNGRKLTNIKPGGSSGGGYKRPRQSEAMRGSKNPMYGKNRAREMEHARSFNKPMSDENRAKVSERSRGERNVKARLTEADVRAIRSEAYRHGLNAELGRKYGVSGNSISQVRSGTTWKHVK